MVLSRRGRPAVFLDRDGTLIEDLGDLRDPAQVRFFPDTVPALLRLDGRFELFIVTNQNGIGRGTITEQQAARVNRHVVEVLAGAGIPIREVYCCPHTRADGCFCIKPRPHFGRLAEKDHGIDLSRSFVIGDHASDVEFAAALGARGIFVLTGHGERHRHEIEERFTVVAGIMPAVDEILSALGF